MVKLGLAIVLVLGLGVGLGLALVFGCVRLALKTLLTVAPCAGSGVVRIDPLHFLAGCHKRRLTRPSSVCHIF